MTYADHYLPIAYVCGKDCIRFTGAVGAATFDQIFTARPEDCRYAVARDAAGKILVWDLFNCIMSMPSGHVLPGSVQTYNDQEAALMATLLLYEE